MVSIPPASANASTSPPPAPCIVGSRHHRRIVGSRQHRRIVGSRHHRRIVGSRHHRRIVGSRHHRRIVGSRQHRRIVGSGGMYCRLEGTLREQPLAGQQGPPAAVLGRQRDGPSPV